MSLESGLEIGLIWIFILLILFLDPTLLLWMGLVAYGLALLLTKGGSARLGALFEKRFFIRLFCFAFVFIIAQSIRPESDNAADTPDSENRTTATYQPEQVKETLAQQDNDSDDFMKRQEIRAKKIQQLDTFVNENNAVKAQQPTEANNEQVQEMERIARANKEEERLAKARAGWDKYNSMNPSEQQSYLCDAFDGSNSPHEWIRKDCKNY